MEAALSTAQLSVSLKLEHFYLELKVATFFCLVWDLVGGLERARDVDRDGRRQHGRQPAHRHRLEERTDAARRQRRPRRQRRRRALGRPGEPLAAVRRQSGTSDIRNRISSRTTTSNNKNLLFGQTKKGGGQFHRRPAALQVRRPQQLPRRLPPRRRWNRRSLRRRSRLQVKKTNKQMKSTQSTHFHIVGSGIKKSSDPSEWPLGG